MTDLQLYSQITSLPADLKKEVSDFVEFLKQKTKTKTKTESADLPFRMRTPNSNWDMRVSTLK